MIDVAKLLLDESVGLEGMTLLMSRDTNELAFYNVILKENLGIDIHSIESAEARLRVILENKSKIEPLLLDGDGKSKYRFHAKRYNSFDEISFDIFTAIVQKEVKSIVSEPLSEILGMYRGIEDEITWTAMKNSFRTKYGVIFKEVDKDNYKWR
jgi:hypothetical protein